MEVTEKKYGNHYRFAVEFHARHRNMSMREIERKAGLANGVVTRWNERVPRVDSLRKVAEVLEVDLLELIATSDNDLLFNLEKLARK